MVWKKIITDRFLLGRRLVPQQQPRSLAPRECKRPWDTSESTKHPIDAPLGPSPISTAILLVIRETPFDLRPTKLVGSNIASSSTPLSPSWQSVLLGDHPLPTNSCIRSWANGQGGRITDSLGQALLFLDNMQYFAKGNNEAISLKLKWHAIAVNFNFSHFIYFRIISISTSNLAFLSLCFNCFVRLLKWPICWRDSSRVPWKRLRRRGLSRRYLRPLCGTKS